MSNGFASNGDGAAARGGTDLTIEVGTVARTPVLHLRGELDVASVGALEAEFERGEQSNPTVIVVDLSRLEFIDASGIRSLLKASGARRPTGTACTSSAGRTTSSGSSS